MIVLDNINPIKRLARAKLLQALQDLDSNPPFASDSEKLSVQTSAEIFFFHRHRELLFWCEMAELHIDFVRDAARRIKDEGLTKKKRKANGTGTRYQQQKAWRARRILQ